jgi:hypothetical protein
MANQLWSLGYIVFHDRQIAEGEHAPSVPELVAMIANCDLYVAIIDQGFTDRVGSKGTGQESISDGWVYDELKTAFILEDAERLKIIGLYIEDCELPRGGFGSDYKLYDFRDRTATQESIHRFFSYGAHPLTPFEVALLTAMDESFMVALGTRDLERARALAQELLNLSSEIPDGQFRSMLVTLAGGDLRRAIAEGEQIQRLFPNMDELVPVLEVARNKLFELGRGS